MTLLIYNEVRLFVICFLLGAGIGMFYDGFRILRMFIHHHELVTDIEDLVFWLITAWFVFQTLFQYNQGDLRGYAFLGMFVGVILYACSLSRLLLYLIKKLLPIWNKGKECLKKPVDILKNGITNLLKKLAFEVKMAIKGR